MHFKPSLVVTVACALGALTDTVDLVSFCSNHGVIGLQNISVSGEFDDVQVFLGSTMLLIVNCSGFAPLNFDLNTCIRGNAIGALECDMNGGFNNTCLGCNPGDTITQMTCNCEDASGVFSRAVIDFEGCISVNTDDSTIGCLDEFD